MNNNWEEVIHGLIHTVPVKEESSRCTVATNICWYGLQTNKNHAITLTVYGGQLYPSGKRGRISLLPREKWNYYREESDRSILNMLQSVPIQENYSHWSYSSGYDKSSAQLTIPHTMAAVLLAELARSNRCFLDHANKIKNHSNFNEEKDFIFIDFYSLWRIEFEFINQKGFIAIDPILCRDNLVLRFSDLDFYSKYGVFIHEKMVGLFHSDEISKFAFRIIDENIEIPENQRKNLLGNIYQLSFYDRFKIEKKHEWQTITIRPKLRIYLEENSEGDSEETFQITAVPVFIYDDLEIPLRGINKDSAMANLVFPSKQLFSIRNKSAEEELFTQLLASGLKQRPPTVADSSDRQLFFDNEKILEQIEQLLDLGVEILIQGKKVRPFRRGNFKISSGVDWFDLEGSVAFTDSEELELPEILAKAKIRSLFVPLSKDSVGIMPEKWWKQCQNLHSLANKNHNGILKFHKSQALFLDYFMEKSAETKRAKIKLDRSFQKLRDTLK
ncbi:MAG: hypothetical protein HQK50_18100, partial [Oligoflexia bacterium]|nr:hypothetical protein [Oligoflexia bacterium]